MCNIAEGIRLSAEALGFAKGLTEERNNAIIKMINLCKKFNQTKKATLLELEQRYSLSKEEAIKYIVLYY